MSEKSSNANTSGSDRITASRPVEERFTHSAEVATQMVGQTYNPPPMAIDSQHSSGDD